MAAIPQLTPAQTTAATMARVIDVCEPDQVATGTIAGMNAWAQDGKPVI
jgi:hypothetical protein